MLESLVTKCNDKHPKINISKTYKLVMHCKATNMDVAAKVLQILKSNASKIILNPAAQKIDAITTV